MKTDAILILSLLLVVARLLIHFIRMISFPKVDSKERDNLPSNDYHEVYMGQQGTSLDISLENRPPGVFKIPCESKIHGCFILKLSWN